MGRSQQVPLDASIKGLHSEVHELHSDEPDGITDFSKNWRGLAF